MIQNKQRKLKILENIYKKLDQLNLCPTVEQTYESKMIPMTKILSGHQYSNSPMTTPRTSPRLDMLTSRVQQMAKENSSFDLYINESSPQSLKKQRDQDVKQKVSSSKLMLKPLQASN